MREIKEEHIDIYYGFIPAVLSEFERNILDISFSFKSDRLIIQFVLINGTSLSQLVIDKLESYFKSYKVEIHYIYSSSMDFNSAKGMWLPKGYKWLDYLVFSKRSNNYGERIN